MTDAIKVEVASLYWRFVDVIWILIFTLVYLVRDQACHAAREGKFPRASRKWSALGWRD